MSYEEIKQRHPDLNWKEAEEIFEEDLQAAAETFDRINNKSTGDENDSRSISQS